MRLTQIRLAGFKTFVDPTVIPVQASLVGIVGPNGCGKSNVIDAVRWVLGESSARHLRGESMQDVIFNGTTTRKPVARASVELIFDNSDGRAPGGWSQYAELSVKRVLVRQGESSYYVNNHRVRRRDVADIFLGTGLGPRAYAIIEQGMISRLVESRPEEMRVFLEEAAGVSKYKERRRETENRLADARENLLRLADLRQELAKNLERLEAQAEKALRYRELMAARERAQALLNLHLLDQAEDRHHKLRQEVAGLELEIERTIGAVRGLEADAEEARNRHFAAGDKVSSVQGELYEAMAQVSSLETRLAHEQESAQMAAKRLEAIEAQLAQLDREEGDARSDMDDWRLRHGEAQQERQEAAEAQEIARLQLPEAEEGFRIAQIALGEAQDRLRQREEAVRLLATRLAHVRKLCDQHTGRRERLRRERASLEEPGVEGLESLRSELAALVADLEDGEERLAMDEETSLEAERQRAERDAHLRETEREEAGLAARRDALDGLLRQVDRGRDMKDWLCRHGLEDRPRLWQHLDIALGWETAAEAVLGPRLHALMVDDFAAADTWIASPPPQPLWLVRPGEESGVREGFAGIVRGGGDFFADIALEPSSGGAWVSREGHLRAPGAIYLHAPSSADAGLLARRRERDEVAQRLEEVAAAAQVQRQSRDECVHQLSAARLRVKEERQRVTALRERRHRLQLSLQKAEQEARHHAERVERLEEEEQEAVAALETEDAQSRQIESELAEAKAEIEPIRVEMERARLHRAETESGLGRAREALRQAEQAVAAGAFAADKAATRLEELERAAAQREDRREDLSAEMLQWRETDHGERLPEIQAALEEALERRGARESGLAEARSALEGCAKALKALEEERLRTERGLEPLRERLNAGRLAVQEARLAAERHREDLADADLAELRQGLVEADENGLRRNVGALDRQIAALGAVNLAALEEVVSERKRAEYLDEQTVDLERAATTLEEAIRKIDRESRTLLMATFETVNRNLGELFPQLFGGGKAELSLTGSEILDAGIELMAQPPGKKNATVHLLSGGEKALTAVALTFAFFRLNPAPFCMLDEVDAPLDDSNTERFGKLLASMAERTQFLFISHNKITMEVANQLVGVTMQERGASRVVAVDMEEAVRLAGS